MSLAGSRPSIAIRVAPPGLRLHERTLRLHAPGTRPGSTIGELKVDWPTVASLVTAGTTLTLAVATFVSVRAGNRTARAAERALQVSLRPVLAPSRLQDPQQKVTFADSHWVMVDGGLGSAEATDQGHPPGHVDPQRRQRPGRPARLAALPRGSPAEGTQAPPRRATRPDSAAREVTVPPGDPRFWGGPARPRRLPPANAGHLRARLATWASGRGPSATPPPPSSPSPGRLWRAARPSASSSCTARR